ncbi:MAG: glycosyltransferase family 1 protein [Halioglobus sp.]|nr:glycosyltransferase family 1 protein [Halioglobus sp.]
MKIGMFLGSVGSNSGGPERYELELVKNLAAIDQTNEYELLTLFQTGSERLADQENFSVRALAPAIRPVSMLTSLPLQMLRSQSDVWHATYLPPPLSPKSYIYTLVCSSMIEHPELFPPAIRLRLTALTNRAIAKAELIVCISDHIRQVVRERYKVSEDRLAVTHLGASEVFRSLDKQVARRFVRDTYGIDRPYFLFSGRWEPRKNIVRIIKAFARFRAESKLDMQLVFSGERTWAAQEADDVIRQYGLESDVVELGKSPMSELPQLYSGAVALAYPSLWEGFGLPIVEAMAAGTPVITSNNSSMREIGGDAAILVDPESVEEIAMAMHSIASDVSLQQSLRDKGLARATQFTWRSTAEQTLALYKRQCSSLRINA